MAFVGLERVVSPPWGENRLTGPHKGQQGASRSGLLLGTKKTAAGVCLAAALGLRLCMLEIFRFFFILRPEEVFLPQVVRLLLGDVLSPLVGVDRAIQFICQAI